MSLQAALMVTLIWTYYSVPVAVVPSRWITPLDRLVAFPTGVAGTRALADAVGERGQVDLGACGGRFGQLSSA